MRLSFRGVLMPRYTTRPTRPARACYDDRLPDGETEGREVYDDGSWSEDQPTGLLTADGEMIYRVRNGIGFLADL